MGILFAQDIVSVRGRTGDTGINWVVNVVALGAAYVLVGEIISKYKI